MREMTIPQYKRNYYPALCSQTIRNWIRQGILQARKTPTGRWLICISDAANDPELTTTPKAAQLLKLMNGGS
ncbi:hypothetical protein D5E79_02800 [Vibrio parahaemolyticus]|nr:hypothetical protein D5E79_02800 [Vibrio parahaemolyticus]TOZ99915.1 hypothetical protein DXE04_00455 [Vibrio parahaemolyticus]